jgi:hypothetical protein
LGYLLGILPFILVIFIIGIFVFSASRRKNIPNDKCNQAKDERNKALADWAQSKGLSFRSGNDSGIGDRYRFYCLHRGDNRYAYNIIEGSISNRKVCVFDYHYVTHSQRRISAGSSGIGPHRHGGGIHNTTIETTTETHDMSAVIVETDLPLKPLFIGIEHLPNKLAEFIGFYDIEFESIEFNKTFCVIAPDKKWAYDVINQKNMELLLNYCHFTIEFNGNCVIAYRDEPFFPGHFEEALQLLTGVMDNIPKSSV